MPFISPRGNPLAGYGILQQELAHNRAYELAYAQANKIASLEAQVKALEDDEIDMLSAVSQCCMKWQVPIIGEKLKELKEARLAAAQTTPSKEKPWGFSESLEVLPAVRKAGE